MFFVAALVICLVIKFRFPKGKSIARTMPIIFIFYWLLSAANKVIFGTGLIEKYGIKMLKIIIHFKKISAKHKLIKLKSWVILHTVFHEKVLQSIIKQALQIT